MKKLLLLTIILAIASLSFAFNPKTFNQQIKVTGSDIMSYVDVASPATDTDWFASATDITAVETITTLTKPASLIRVCTMSGPVGIVAWVIFDAQAFATLGAVPVGRQFSVTITYLGNPNPTTNSATRIITTGTGGAQWFYTPVTGTDNSWYLPASMFNQADVYQLTIGSIPVGVYPILKNAEVTGNSTPWSSAALASPDSLVGTYSLATEVGYHWEPASIEVTAGDFITRTAYQKNIYFTKVLDQGTYELTITSTPPGAAIFKDGVNTNFVTPWISSPGAAGTYSVQMAGYTWNPTEIVVPTLTQNTSISFTGTQNQISITANYAARIYKNGIAINPAIYTTGTNVPVMLTGAGTYSVVRANTVWTPASYVFDGISSQSIRFIGVMTPVAVTNPVPTDNYVYQIPFSAPTTAVYPLSWGAVTGVTGYKVYFGADPATPELLATVTTGTTVNTPAIGEGAYTWRVVPYITDPAKGGTRSLAPVKAAISVSGTRGDGPAVDWHFTIVRLPEPDTYTYNLQVNGPAGYAVTGPVNGTTPYLATDNDGTQANSLLGSYTIAAAPANFHWEVNPIVVIASNFVPARTNYIYNATITFVLVENPTIATPTISPAAGTYTTAQNVTLACTTPGAQIRYTTNGTEPTATSTLYSVAINVATTTTIKAKGFLTNWIPSATATAAYVITGTVATPTFTPAAGTYTTAQNVTLACTTAGAQIRYTTDGTDPTATSTLYSAAIPVAATLTIKAKGFLTDWTPSAVATAAYVITGTVATPTFTPEPGNYQNQLDVTLACATAGASIRYTLDGTEPVATSPLYSLPIHLTQTTTIKAKGFKTDWTTSATASGLYDIAVANPEEPNVPVVTGISDIYPNPFNSSTTIKLGVKEANQGYQLNIYNIKGECVYRNAGNAKGSFDLKWNGHSSSGEKLPSGIYLISFTSGSTTQTRKAVIK
ncbi:MAG: hypothetical protein CVU50_07315 [Candidatus Cloacimonetes bacterium HGW-Cloacimonetes-3]|jgi:hypothetical protein|nr:MAG: hypothetical protein CVU50_07315 [Candidatus Cloacimonetes bacterium HGW-Cloacimonetes-3]